MSKTKAKADAKDKAASAPTVQRQPETPEKVAGPQRAAPTMTSALPSPNGTLSAARAADVMTATEQSAGTAGRARMMAGMQQTVGNARVSRMLGTAVQAKLTVGAPNDVYEREADRVADQVTRMPAPTDEKPSSETTSPYLQRCPACQKKVQRQERDAPGLCSECRQRLQAGGTLQRQATTSETPAVTPETESYLKSSRGGGQPLPAGTREPAEVHLGRDFSGVRVHDDTAANDAAQSLNARAFTRGSDVYLARGESASDRRLMGHELTHVVQQGGRRRSGRRAGGLSKAAYRVMRLMLPPGGYTQLTTNCFAPSFFLPGAGAAGFGIVAEKFIELDYCRQMGCAPGLSDYFDNPFAGPVDPQYVAFLLHHNPGLSPRQRTLLRITSIKRPDIVTHTAGRQEYYEIKPKSPTGLRAGIFKLVWIDQLMRILRLPYTRGHSYTPTHMTPMLISTLPDGTPVEIYFRTLRPTPGLLLYDLCIRTDWRKVTLVVLAAIAAAIVIILSRGRLVPGRGPVRIPVLVPAAASAGHLPEEGIPEENTKAPA